MYAQAEYTPLLLHGQGPLSHKEAIMASNLKQVPFRSKLVTPEEEIDGLRRLARLAQNAGDLRKSIDIQVGILAYLDQVADALEEELPQTCSEDGLPRYGQYL